MKTIFASLLALFVAQDLSAQCWNLIWSDEFNGQALDQSKWTAGNEPGYDGEEEYYRPRNVSVAGGALKISALHQSYGGLSYTSGKVVSDSKFSFAYGKIEARMKLPVGKGCWPAFWLLPQDDYNGLWPQGGEVDIMEMISQLPSTLYSTIHCTDIETGEHVSAQGVTTLAKGDFSDAYHLFTGEWDPDEFRFYLDGGLFATMSKASYPRFNWPFDRPFYVLINLALGGGWAEPPDPAVYPQYLYLDYVRVYQQNDQLSIVGSPIVQPRTVATYSVPQISGASYAWSVSGHGTIVSGQNSSALKARWDTTAGDRTVTCGVTTACGVSRISYPVVVTANVLLNPDFEDDLHYWTTQNSNGSVVEFSIDTTSAQHGAKSLHSDVSAIGINPWDVQLLQSGFSLKKNHQYGISFWAKAVVAGKILDCSVLNSDNYAQLGSVSVTLSTAWQYFNTTFTPSAAQRGLLTLDFGTQTGIISLDNVALIDLTLNGSAGRN